MAAARFDWQAPADRQVRRRRWACSASPASPTTSFSTARSRARFRQQKRAKSSSAQELAQARKAEFAYQKDLAELTERQQRQRELNKILPMASEYPAFLSAIQNVANVSGVQLAAWSPSAEVAEQFYARVPMKLTLVGRYHQVAKFFYGVSQLDRIINLENIDAHQARGARAKTCSFRPRRSRRRSAPCRSGSGRERRQARRKRCSSNGRGPLDARRVAARRTFGALRRSPGAAMIRPVSRRAFAQASAAPAASAPPPGRHPAAGRAPRVPGGRFHRNGAQPRPVPSVREEVRRGGEAARRSRSVRCCSPSSRWTS